MQNLQFKKDFYLDPSYLGYWQTKGSEQNFNYYNEANPIRLNLLRNELEMKRTEKSIWMNI